MYKWAKRAVLFALYRVWFPLQYAVCRRKPLEENKAVFIELNQPTLSASLSYLYKAMQQEGDYRLNVHYIRQNASGKLGYIRNAGKCLRDMATAHYVFLCEGNRFVSCIRPRKETYIAQLWHGCGAFKKFGFSTTGALFGGDEREYERYNYYRNYDCVTVSSPEVVWAYAQAMHLPEASPVIKPIGISRTDLYFEPGFSEKSRRRIEEACPWIQGRKLLLYAPTFRGHTSKATAPDGLDIGMLAAHLQEEYVLLIKHHPAVRQRPEIPEKYRNTFAADVTQGLEIETLIGACDICISDYSSLVFEYSLMDRPMLFFACDLDDYRDWRGFYYSYEEMTPGPVVTSTEKLTDYLVHWKDWFDPEVIRDFRQKFMCSCDGGATQRLLDAMKEKENRP